MYVLYIVFHQTLVWSTSMKYSVQKSWIILCCTNWMTFCHLQGCYHAVERNWNSWITFPLFDWPLAIDTYMYSVQNRLYKLYKWQLYSGSIFLKKELQNVFMILKFNIYYLMVLILCMYMLLTVQYIFFMKTLTHKLFLGHGHLHCRHKVAVTVIRQVLVLIMGHHKGFNFINQHFINTTIANLA